VAGLPGGPATDHAYAFPGHFVVAADGRSVAVPYGHDRRAAMETLADIETNGGSGFAISADLTDPDAAETL
jgi:hypothetical protein